MIFFSLVAAVLIYLLGAIIFSDMGLLKYHKLQKTKLSLEKEITLLEGNNRKIKEEVTALKEDPYFIEKHAREEFGLARPEEYIFQFQSNDGK
jgi:cell division protein FtsB